MNSNNADTEQNKQEKRYDLYKNALKRAIKAGAEDIDDDLILNELCKTLKIDSQMHTKLLKEVLKEEEELEKKTKESNLKISRVEQQISDLKKKEMNVSPLEDILKNARRAKKKKEFVEFDSYITECSNLAKGLTRQNKIIKQIEGVKKIIEKAEKLGANVKSLKQLVKRSESHLKKNDFTNASKLVSEAKKSSVKLRKFSSAKRQIMKLLSTHEKAKKIFDVSECNALVKRAQHALSENDYTAMGKAITAAKKALLASKRHYIATEKVNKIRKLVKEELEAGIDLDKIKPEISLLEQYLKQKEYTKLNKQTTNIRKALNDAKRYKNAGDNIIEAHNAIENAKVAGSSVKTASRLLSQAKGALKKKKFVLVHKYARSSIKIAKDGMRTAIRRKASSAISSAKFLIKDIKGFGVDIREAEEILSKADLAFNKKDFENVNKYAQEAEELAKRVFEKKKKDYMKKGIQETLVAVKLIVEKLKEQHVNTSKIEDLFSQASSKLKTNEFEAAEKIANNAEEIAREVFEHVKKENLIENAYNGVENLKELLENARDLKIDNSTIQMFESELNNVEKLYEQKDYEKVIDKTTELKKKVLDIQNDALESRIQKKIEWTEKLITKAKNAGVDLLKAEKIMDDVKDNFDSGNFTKAEELLEHCKNIANDEWSHYRLTESSSAIGGVEQIISEAIKAKVDLTQARELLTEAHYKLDSQDFDGANDLISKAETIAESQWHAHRIGQTEKSLENLKKILNDLTTTTADRDAQDTANLKDFQRLIDKAEEKLNQSELEVANEYINQANVISSNILHNELWKTHSNRIDKNQLLIVKLKESGIESAELESQLVLIQEFFANKDIHGVEENLDHLENKIHELFIERRAEISTGLLHQTRETIGSTREIGGSVVKAEEYLSDVERLLIEDEFDIVDAQELLSKAEHEAKQSWTQRKTEIAKESVTSTQTLIKETQELGVDVHAAEQLLNEVEEMFKDDDFNAINDNLKNINEELLASQHEQKTKLATEAVTSTKALLDETRVKGIEVGEAEDLLGQAESMFDKKDFDAVDRYIRLAENVIKSSQIEFTIGASEKLIASTCTKIDEGRNQGVDVTEAQQLLQLGEIKLREGDFQGGYECLQKAEELVGISQAELKKDETSKLVSSTRAKIDEGREQGADVTEAEELLRQAENMLLTESNFESVGNLIEESQVSLASSWDHYHSQKSLDGLSKIREKTSKYRSLGLNVTDTEVQLTRAEQEYQGGNLDNVDQLLDQIGENLEQEHEEFYSTKVAAQLDEIRSLITQAKEKHLDVNSAEELLKLAISEVGNKNYNQAENLANSIKNSLTKLFEDVEKVETEELINMVKTLISDAKALNIDVNPAERLFRQAQALFKAQEFTSSREYAHKSEDVLKSLAEKSIKDIHPHLTVKIDAIGMIANKWNKCIIQLSNEGKIKAQDIEIELKGDFEVKGIKNVPVVESEENFELELGLKTKKIGELPVNIQMKCYRPFDRNEYNFIDTINVNIQEVGRFVVQDVFLIYEDGSLIVRKTRGFHDMADEDIFSSMLVAVQSFVSDSFKKASGEGLKRLDFGENKVLIERGHKFFLATVIEGAEPGILLLYIVETIDLIQKKFGDILENWNGIINELEGIGDIVERLLNISSIEYTSVMDLPEEKCTISTVKSMISEVKELGIDTSKAEQELQKAQTMVESSDYSTVWDHVQTSNELIRETRRKHYYEDVKSSIEHVKNEITQAKAIGADVASAEETFNKMKELVQTEAYPEVLQLATTATEVTQQAKYGAEVKRSFDNLNNNITITAAWGINTSSANTQKEQINAILEKNEFGSAEKNIQEATEQLKLAVINKPMEALPVVATLNQDLEDLKNYGIDTKEPSGLLHSAKQAINDGDFSSANDLFSQVKEKLSTKKNNYFQTKASETISSANTSIGELQKMNINVDSATNLLSQAKNNYDENKFENAYESAIETQDILEDMSHTHQSKPILETISSAEKIISVALARGVDQTKIQPIEELIKNTRNALDERDYKTAGDWAIQANTIAMDDLSTIKKEHEALKAQLDSTMSAITSTKNLGADTTEVESLMDRINKVLDEGDIEATKEYMKNIQGTLEKLQIPYQTHFLSNEIAKTEQYITETKEKGIDTSEQVELLKSAKIKVKSEDFTSVEVILKNIREVLDHANEEYRAVVISETIQSTYKLATEVKEMGVEVDHAFELLKQAEVMLEKKNLDNAEGFATKALNTTEEVKKLFLSRETSEQISKAEHDINKAKGDNLNTIDADRLLNQAKSYFESGDMKNSKHYAINAQQLVSQLKEKTFEADVKEKFADIKLLYSEMKNLGANVTAADAPIMQAQASLNQEEFKSALTYIEHGKTTLDQIKQPYIVKLATSAVQNARNVIANARNYGANIAEAEIIFNLAQNILSSGDYYSAEEKAKHAEKLAIEAQRKYYENYISSVLTNLKVDFEKFKTQGHDLTEAGKMVDEIDTLYLEKKFQDINNKVSSLRAYMAHLEEERYIDRAKDTLSYSKAMINYIKNNIKDIGTRIKEPEQLIQDANKALKESSYKQAEKLALSAQSAVENIKHSKLEQFLFVFRQLQTEEMLNDARKVIASIKRLNVDITKSEELMKQAEDAFKDGGDKYEVGQELLTEAKRLAHEEENKAHEKSATNAISAAESLIITLKSSGVNVGSATQLLDQAKTALKICEFKKSILFAGKAKLAAKKLQKSS